MEVWLRNTFETKYYEIDDLEVFIFNDGKTEGHMDVFLDTFGHLEPTYESLSSYANEIESGWIVHFDSWKEQGILN